MKNIKISTIAAIAVMLLCTQLFSQVVPSPPGPNPAAIEGTISSVTLNSDRSLELTVMDIVVKVPFGVTISTPTATLTPEQVADPTPFPGRSQPGFVGGTAIVLNGQFDDTGAITASDLLVEPAENVVLGLVTGHALGQVLVNKIPVSLLQDARMPSHPARNIFGFDIVADALLPGIPVSVEGYFSKGTFYAFLFEIDGVGQLTTTDPQIAILRAQSRERTPNNQKGDEVEVRGGITTAHLAPGVTTQNVQVFRVDNGIERLLGNTTATVDPATPGATEWRFRVTTPTSNNVVYGSAPTRIRAKMPVRGANGVTVNYVTEADAVLTP